MGKFSGEKRGIGMEKRVKGEKLRKGRSGGVKKGVGKGRRGKECRN